MLCDTNLSLTLSRVKADSSSTPLPLLVSDYTASRLVPCMGSYRALPCAHGTSTEIDAQGSPEGAWQVAERTIS